MKAIRYTCLVIGQILFIMAFMACRSGSTGKSGSRSYYISSDGNDENDGSKQHPWQTIKKINSVKLHAGDAVLLRGGDTFTGTLRVRNINGTASEPVLITSY